MHVFDGLAVMPTVLLNSNCVPNFYFEIFSAVAVHGSDDAPLLS